MKKGGQREREGERKECCVIYHGLVTSGLLPSLQASIKCATEKIKCGPKKKNKTKQKKDTPTGGIETYKVMTLTHGGIRRMLL